MSIRESRQRSRRSRRGTLEASGPVPHSARARRHNKLSLRRRRRSRGVSLARAGGEGATNAVAPETPVASPAEPAVTIQGSGLPAQCLSELTGISPTMEKQLHAMGQTRFFQIAHWTDETLSDVAEKLSLEPAHIRNTNWIGQARRRG